MSAGVAAILLAGGSGTRMRMDGNKVYLPLAGRPALCSPLATLAAAPEVACVVLVARGGDMPAVQEVLDLVAPAKEVVVVPGGATRHLSEQAGLAAVKALMAGGHAFDVVAIHDGARPFLTRSLLSALVAAARTHGGAVPALALAATVFEETDGKVAPRPSADLVTVQTPQVFRVDALLAAYAAALADGFDGVDTAQVLERYTDLRVAAVPGDERNVKVTNPDDLPLAERLAAVFVDGEWTDR